MTSKNTVNVLCGAVLACLVLTGCGKNSLFKGISSPGDAETQTQSMTSKLKNGNYQEALNLANAVLADNNSTPAQKQIAYLTKGKSLLVLNKVDSLYLMSSVLNVRDGNSTANIFEIMRKSISGSVSANIRLAAVAYNSASGISTASTSNISQGAQFDRAVSNLVVVLSNILNYYSIDKINSSTYKATPKGSLGAGQILNRWFDLDGKGTTSNNSIFVFSSNGSSALSASGMGTDVQDLLKKITRFSDDVEKMNTSSGYTTQSNKVVKRNTSSDADIQEALDEIITKSLVN